MRVCPYRLFDFYTYEDRSLFFGRDEEVAQMVGDILSTRLLVVFAPSGSGKSSLLHAGVRPALEKRGLDFVLARVGEDPLGSIIQALNAGDNSSPGVMDLSTALRSQKKPVVVAIDQFEELFLQFDERSEKRKNFPARLAEVLYDPSLRVYFVLSLRSEYFVALNEFREAIPTIFQNNANIELRPFDDACAMEAIVSPSTIEGSGYSWQPGLPERIIQDLKNKELNPRENGVMPITLQIVCHTLWNHLPDGKGEITGKMYEDAGKATRIIEQRIFQALNVVKQRDRRLLCRTLRELISKERTKRICSLSQLHAAVSKGQVKRMDSLLQKLKDDLLLREEEVRQDTWIELRHDYLANRITDWLETEENRLDSLRRRNNLYWGIGGVIGAVFIVWLWIGYHTYTAELGAKDREGKPEDELLISRQSPIWKLRIASGFSRDSLQASGVPNYTFQVPDALSDWSAIEPHLGRHAKVQLQLATHLDVSDGPQEKKQPRPFEVLKYMDIGYYLAADNKVLKVALSALETGDLDAKQAAARALGALGPHLPSTHVESVVSGLLRALKDSDVKHATAWALGDLGPHLPAAHVESVVSGLLRALKDSDVKHAAAAALEALGPHLPVAQVELVVTSLLPDLTDSSSGSRDAATYLLGTLGPHLPAAHVESVVAGLLTTLQDFDIKNRGIGAMALGALGPHLPPARVESVVASILTVLKDSNSRNKAASAKALGALGPHLPAGQVESVVAGMLTVLKDSDTEVRRIAAEALGALGPHLPATRIESVVAGLLVALKDSNSRNKAASAKALGALGPHLPVIRVESVVSALLMTLKDSGSDFRFRIEDHEDVLRALVSHLPVERIEWIVVDLLTTLKDSDFDKIIIAVKALKALGPHLPAIRVESVVSALLMTLKDSGNDFRFRYSSDFPNALGALISHLPVERIERKVADLLATLQDSKIDNRNIAVRTLGALGPHLPAGQVESVVAGMLTVLKDSDTEVRRIAAEALGALGPHLPAGQVESVLAGLLTALQGSDIRVKEVVVEALGKLASNPHIQYEHRRETVIALSRITWAGEDWDHERSRGISISALRILTQQMSTPDTEQLLGHLESLESEPRTLAAQILPRRKLSQEQIDQIRLLRDDPKHRPWVRLAALNTLVEIQREASIVRKEAEAESKKKVPSHKM